MEFWDPTFEVNALARKSTSEITDLLQMYSVLWKMKMVTHYPNRWHGARAA